MTQGVHGLKLRLPRIVLGVALMLVGAILLADKLALADTSGAWRWWPLLPIGFGISKLVQSWDTPERGSGAWLVFTGIWFLAVNFHLFGFTYHNSWPVLVVAVGVSMIGKALLEKKPEDGGSEVPDGR